MTEDVPSRAGPFKIWRNPDSSHDVVAYMGDYYAPGGRAVFVPQDLVELGFVPGEYTIRVPESLQRSRKIAKWHKLRVAK